MGSSASKAARKYPEAIGKAVGEHGIKKPSVPPQAAARLAESHKSEGGYGLFDSASKLTNLSFIDIERDSADPHFLSNLNKLGPVRVDHHMQPIRPVSRFVFYFLLHTWNFDILNNKRRQPIRNSSLNLAKKSPRRRCILRTDFLDSP